MTMFYLIALSLHILLKFRNVIAIEKTTSIPIITTNSDLLTEINAYLNGNTLSRTAIGTWDVSGLADFSYAFYGLVRSGFNEDISGWNVAAATNMEYMFAHSYTFNQDISSWNVASVTNMQYMFHQAYAFNQDLSSWNVASVTNMQYMLHQAYAFNQDLCGWSGKLSTSTTVTNAFLSSGCTVTTDPVLTTSPQGPLCRACSTAAPTTASPTTAAPTTAAPTTAAPTTAAPTAAHTTAAPTAAPTTASPTAPTAPTTPAPTGESVTVIVPCFASTVTVDVEGKNQTSMDSLMVGDKVLTGSGSYKPVYMISHFHHSRTASFLQIHTNLTKEKPLEMTPNHMIFIHSKDYPVPAAKVRVGDKLRSLDGPVEVTAIKMITRSGYYNPLTTDGTIVVDGLVASTYTSYSGNTHIQIGDRKILPLQTIMGLASDPYGALCTTFSLINTCNQHNETAGITIFMRHLHDYWSKQNDFRKYVILAAYLMFFGLLNVLHQYYTLILGAFVSCICYIKMKKMQSDYLSHSALN